MPHWETLKCFKHIKKKKKKKKREINVCIHVAPIQIKKNESSYVLVDLINLKV